jgi:hypothetical protein
LYCAREGHFAFLFFAILEFFDLRASRREAWVWFAVRICVAITVECIKSTNTTL